MFRVQVIADNSGKWCGNALTFQTEAEAETYARDLYARWTLVRQWRIERQCATCETWYVWQSETTHGARAAQPVVNDAGFYCSRVCLNGSTKLKQGSAY